MFLYSFHFSLRLYLEDTTLHSALEKKRVNSKVRSNNSLERHDSLCNQVNMLTRSIRPSENSSTKAETE